MTAANNAVQTDGYLERLVGVSRTTKVVKGGRILAFAATVVVGDGNGKVGFGRGKAREVPVAIQKATEEAKRSMASIPLINKTFHHEIIGRHGASRVMIQPAPKGTGVIAGSAMRAIFEVMGVENVVAKCLGSTNPVNIVRATINGMKNINTPERVAQKRGKTVADILGKDGGKADE